VTAGERRVEGDGMEDEIQQKRERRKGKKWEGKI
jgi:hypothetical protein